MTTRLSISSFAGIARTLVAVGTARLASMLDTTRAAAPLSGWVAGVPDGSRRACELSRSLAESGCVAAGRAVGSLRGWEALSPSLVPRSVAPLLPTPLARSAGASDGVRAGFTAGSFEDLVVVLPFVDVDVVDVV